MKRTVNVFFIAAAGVAASTALAQAQVQTRPAAVSPQRVELQPMVVAPQEQTVRLQATITGEQRVQIEARTTTGRPYSAEAVTDTTQVLADGNRIERQTVTRIYRDGQGRTRREQITGGVVKSISISDPVTGVSYTLDPENKTARRSSRALLVPSVVLPGGSGGSVARAGGGGAGVGAGAATGGGTGTGTGTGTGVGAGAVARGGGGGGGGFGGRAIAPAVVGTSDPNNVKKEELAPQNVEGVMARGTRTTTTIPAGSIGNLQDIRIVSEQWFSEDLQVLVMTKHSDPRSGETVYRLRGIVRAEPDPSLFTVPADYTVQEMGGARGRGRGGE